MNCPFCSERIWGEGWNSKTGERFYSHVSEGEDCAWELGIDIDGSWKKYSGASSVPVESPQTEVDMCVPKETLP